MSLTPETRVGDDNNKNNNTDEAQVLASVAATLQEQNVYEDQVIRQATHSLAPLLTESCTTNDGSFTPRGFPPLHALAPSYDARAAGTASRSDVPQVHAVLTNIRRQQEQTGNNNNDLLYFQEQMLLSFLLNVAGIPPEDLPIHDEARNEYQRSLAFSAADTVNTEDDATATPAAAAAAPQRRPRVPMMQRRKLDKQAVTIEEEDDVETDERKKELRQLRRDRKKRREQRRVLLEEDSSSCSVEESEFGNDNMEVANSVDKDDKDDGEKEKSSVTCPLCQQELTISDSSQTDALLSQHMDQCQRRSSRRRPKTTTSSTVAAKPRKRKRRTSSVRSKRVVVVGNYATSKDDLQEWVYVERVDDWIEQGLSRMKDMKERDVGDALPGAETLPGGLYIPAWVNDRLFGYQREGIKWMFELHQQQVGGVVGDEMGLGKTVQVCAFLGILGASRKIRSALIVSPATMLQHWLNEIAIWAPGFRRILIHPSGETDGVSRNVSPKLLRALAKWIKDSRRDRVYEAIDQEDWENEPHHSFCGTGYVVVTTYENFRRNADIYTAHEWSYIVLDEAQRIKCPDAEITLACKRIRTPHRLAMSGTPIQNDLRELWSLFDFVFPGRLGTLPAFEQEFADPIKRGGYANCTPMQVQLAYRCSLTLRDLINPFLLRRQKKEIKEVSRMPSKTEHVLFCRLSQRQRSMYEAFIRSDEVARVLRGSNQLLAAVTVLRKICNHPDLVCDPNEASYQSFLTNGSSNIVSLDEETSSDLDDEFGNDESLMERSGKLEVLSKILPLWYKQGHRVLVFCQWKKMLNIIQRFMMLKGWKFGRLDGNTNISARQRLVDQFNANDSKFFALLCTTRTGGVGLNLTGANRIILYDPDWNPSTDAQARERAWRFGQEKEVTIYRLITAGTVEEKIYQRQIFKTALSNKVLQDPRQRRLFSQRDLHDLFSLTADGGSVRAGGDGLTDTAKATRGVGALDFEQDVVGKSDDNERTLRKVMQSKGLASVFDHHYLEGDPSRKSATVREMEEQAKRVAREAARALEQSFQSHNPFTPTWTGSEETAPQRFGDAIPQASIHQVRASGISHPPVSSRDILSSLRKKNQAIESGGQNRPLDDTRKYAGLLGRLKNFVRLRAPSTDDILKEFDSIPNSDVAIFRRLLQSVATLDRGKWYLK